VGAVIRFIGKVETLVTVTFLLALVAILVLAFYVEEVDGMEMIAFFIESVFYGTSLDDIPSDRLYVYEFFEELFNDNDLIGFLFLLMFIVFVLNILSLTANRQLFGSFVLWLVFSRKDSDQASTARALSKVETLLWIFFSTRGQFL